MFIPTFVSLFAHYSKPNHTSSHTCTLTKKCKSLHQQAPNKTEWNLIQVIHAGSSVWPGELMVTLIKGCWSPVRLTDVKSWAPTLFHDACPPSPPTAVPRSSEHCHSKEPRTNQHLQQAGMCPASTEAKAYEKTDRYPEWKTSPDTFGDETPVRCYLYIWSGKEMGVSQALLCEKLGKKTVASSIKMQPQKKKIHTRF